MPKTDFDLLLQRYVTGKVSEQERAKIDAWLDAIGAEDNTDLELSKEEEDRIFQKLTSTLTSIDEIKTLKPKRKLRTDQWVARIAASLTIMALLSFAVWYYIRPSNHQMEIVSKNGVDKVILNDGSLVWLRGKGSHIAFSENNEEGVRYATFQGEALFEVAKNESRPFIVQCGDVKVKVLGTSFSINASADLVELTVLTGKVNFSLPTDSVGITLLPHEKALYMNGGAIVKLAASDQEITAITVNTDYNMQFTNTLMSEVIARLESKFNVSVKLANKDIGNCMITMDFTDKSLEKSLQLMTEVLNITCEVQGKTVQITGTGCQ